LWVKLLLVAALPVQGGTVDELPPPEGVLTPILQPNGLFEIRVASDTRQVRVLRMSGASRVWVNDQVVAAPLNPVVLVPGVNRIWGAPIGDELPQLELSVPAGPVFFDVDGVDPMEWNPRIKTARQDILVVNASEEPVPMLTLVCGGVGPFLRKRVPIWRGLPPLSVMRVSLPLMPNPEYWSQVKLKKYPLFLSAAGIQGVDPLVQSLSIPRGSPSQRPAPAKVHQAVAPVHSQIEQFREGALAYQWERSGDSVIHRSGVDHWRLAGEHAMVLRLSPDARLVRLQLNPYAKIRLLRMGADGDFQDWNLDAPPFDRGGKTYWAEWDGAQWQLHRHGVPVHHKGLHRRGPVNAAFKDAVWIYGTAGSKEENQQILKRLRLHSGAWLAMDPSHRVDLISDVEFLEVGRGQEFVGQNLVVIGNADTNRAWSSLAAADLPIQFHRGWLQIAGSGEGGGNKREGAFGGVVLQPRPGDSHAFVLFLGDTGVEGAKAACGLMPEQMDQVEFALTGGGRVGLAAGLKSGCFDHRWRFPSQLDLAENE